ncbi:PREDICTED: cilia- and flagella-associated protein 20-like [Trachymyrmex septentrionalis]|uniref:cilia- and flagella-associated protein 20-like n=1 Tax=Trachymyrmex septentrionalis TaxID=34720 RepID=UPI00084F3127|nr:PREDICTED: cilia- and flagella-associated protein 20-like [Trachymyrmex septentrionalis]
MSKNEIYKYMSLLYSVANKPLDLWSKHVSFGGKVHRINDDLLHGDKVIEITEPHNNTIPTSITTPAKALDILNIKLPVLVLVIKNLNLRFKLEVQIIDKQQYRRRFSFMTYNIERLPRINASVARIPLKLDDCWNFLEINLQTLCHQVYKTDYEALQRVTIYPNCHLRRVYLQDRHYKNDETHIELYQAFFNMYMLKQGINFIEKSCQTEDCYTGPLEQSDLNCFIKDNFSSTPLTKVDSRKTAGNIEKFESNLSMNLNLYNSDTLKRNYMSLDVLNSAIKKWDVFTRRSEYFTKSLQNDPVIENKLERKR